MKHFVLKEIDSWCVIPACKSGEVIACPGMRWIQRWYPGRICTVTTEVFEVTCPKCLEAIQRDVANRLAGLQFTNIEAIVPWDGKAPEI